MKIHSFSTLGEISHFAISGHLIISGFDITGVDCIYIYMFICTELIEETRRPPGLIFGMWGYFWPGSDKSESWKFFHTFDGVMT